MRKRVGMLLLAGLALVTLPSVAAAQYVAPIMDPIPEVLDWASVAEAIALAGATVLAIIFAWTIGFRLIHKLSRRTVRGI